MSTALFHLNTLADQRKAQRSPNFPAKRIPRSKYSDVTANGLKRCIVDYLSLLGYFCIRPSSTGTCCADLQGFVASQQRPGLPAVFVVVKIGADRLSDVQKQAIVALLRAGASVYVAHDFAGFYDWFTALVPTLADADALPFGPIPTS